MSTRSTSTDLVPPFSDPESVIRNRQRNLGPPPAGPNIPAPDLLLMEELLQAPTDGVGDAIVVPPFLLIDTFYNGLSQSDQDSLNSAAGGNLLTRNTQEALMIIENKSKVEALGKHVSSMNKQIHSIQDSCDSCCGPHSSYECQAINNMNQEEVYAYSGNEEPSVPPPPLSSSSKEVVSINLMPLFVWKKLMPPELIPTCMTLDLANQSMAYPAGIAEDVCVQVGKFTFHADFFIIDYDVDPRVPFILGRPFLRTARALVNVYGEELILRDGDEKLIFHVESTSKYPHNPQFHHLLFLLLLRRWNETLGR
nr:reverse transcriptase domain-containing protein [Tanacetum cinerariifolium]